MTEHDESLSGDRIRSLTLERFTVALPQAQRGGVTDAEYVMATITTEGGVAGVACGFTRGVPFDAFEHMLGAIVRGRAVSDVRNIQADCAYAGELFAGRNGAFSRALSLVDIAIWDAFAIGAGLPLAQLLGGGSRSVDVMATAGAYRPEETLDSLAAEFSTLVSQGYTRFKLMGNGATRAHNVDRIRVVREVLPAGASLALDMSGTFLNASDALRYLDVIGDHIDFLEDPFRPENVRALGELRRHNPITIAIGEWESGIHRFRTLLEEGLVDIARLDATSIGGISEFTKVAGMLEAWDVTVIPHYFTGLHLPLAAACRAVEAIEFVSRATGAVNYDDLMVDGLWDGVPVAVPSTRPGVGVEWKR